MTTVDIEFVPRSQFKPYLNRDKRWSCIVAHRRAGKTVACIMDLIKQASESTRREPRFAYVAPTYIQAKDVAFSYLKEYTAAIPGIKVSESELSVTFPHNGARIRLYGADNYDRLRGLYLDGCIIDEAGDIDPRAWSEVIRPALSDRQGWATFIGTPKGRNAFYRLFQQSEGDEDWYSLRLRASETGIIPEKELADARRTMTDEAFRAEYETDFDVAIRGAFYGREVTLAENEGRVCKVAHDRAADVYASWDLGIGDSMAIWVFQIVGQEYHFLDYYENDGFGLDHYVDWVKSLPYRVDTHLLPHDAEARELQTGKNRVEYLTGRGLDCEVVPQHRIEDGIDAVRMRFNRFWFDREKCVRGVDRLRMYRSEFDEKHGVLRKRPLHDESSHGADAFRYGIMGAQERKPVPHDIDYERAWVV